MVVAWESLSKLAILNCSFPISEASQLPGPAVNASQIHPWDIGVIGALGNSVRGLKSPFLACCIN